MWFLLLALADCDPSGLPPLSDLDRFSTGHVSANSQLRYCRRWLEIVKEAEGVCGYSDGRFLVWRSSLDFAISYWTIYADASERNAFGHGTDWNRGRLADLRDLIGPARYLAGWAPLRRIEPPWPKELEVEPQ